MKEYQLRFIRIVACLGVVLCTFYFYLPQMRSNVKVMNTTVGEQHVDVLCVGSSHMFCGINPIQMYKDYGFASYTLGVGSQSPWQSYFYIKQACKKQSPSIIIQDAYMLGLVQDPNDYKDYQTVSNLLYEPLSFDKICAVMESVADSRLNILLRFPYNYNEYNSFDGFTKEKFVGYEDYSMGYQYRSEVANCNNLVDVSNYSSSTAISSINEEYLLKIVEYCQEEGIVLIVLNSPSPMISEDEQKYYNYIEAKCLEYGVPFIDGNKCWNKIGIDWNYDSSDGGHMNHSGVTKFTKYVEEYIVERYTLPDRRMDENYCSYDEGVKWLEINTNA